VLWGCVCELVLRGLVLLSSGYDAMLLLLVLVSECMGCHCPACVYIYQRWHLNADGICSGYLQQNIPRYHTKVGKTRLSQL